MSGSVTAEIMRQSRLTRLSNVVCTLGRHDKPYPEVHEAKAWTIALVRRGTFRYRGTATNLRQTLRPGWLLVGQPGASFECSHEHDGGDDCAALTITEEALHEVASAAGIAMKPFLASAPVLAPLPRASALFERVRLRDNADLDEAGYSITEAVLASASGASFRDVAPHPSHAARMADAIDEIERSCCQPLSLSAVANAVDLSPFHFLRVFRRVTGTTPHQYLIGARLRLAVQLLLDTEKPITEIASEVGFEDLSNFINTFHRVVGASPREYRRR
jgi:AraC-like DNA-binding protein